MRAAESDTPSETGCTAIGGRLEMIVIWSLAAEGLPALLPSAAGAGGSDLPASAGGDGVWAAGLVEAMSEIDPACARAAAAEKRPKGREARTGVAAAANCL